MAEAGSSFEFANGVHLQNFNKGHAADINRYLGGHRRGMDSHPFVKGYFYVFFGFPSNLFGAGDDKSGNSFSSDEALIYSLSAAEGFTPPGDRQLKPEDIAGMGGVDSSFITGQTLDRNFSIQYRDYWGAPLFRIHRQWTQYLNPYFGGVVAPYKNGMDGSEFAAHEYKGTCMVIQTKPVTKLGGVWDESHIIKVDYFDGVFPTTDLKSAYDSNITDNTIARPTVQYRFDGFPLDETDPNVMRIALNALKTVRYENLNSSAGVYQDLINQNEAFAINNPSTSGF